MVFVDDDSAECARVRSALPEVTVLQVPARIYELPDLLRASGLFDKLAVHQEDKERVHYYQAEQGRREIQNQHVDQESFLRELQMKAVVRPLQNADIPRAAQLCQRTNQFNLTSRRYTEADLASFLSNPDVAIFTLQAEDRFGSMGHSGLIVWKKSGDTAEVDTFLMSCRIIGRRFDRALFCESLRQANGAWGCANVQADYIPTAKNGIVAGLWQEYGLPKIPSENGQRFGCPLGGLKVTFPDVIALAENV